MPSPGKNAAGAHGVRDDRKWLFTFTLRPFPYQHVYYVVDDDSVNYLLWIKTSGRNLLQR